MEKPSINKGDLPSAPDLNPKSFSANQADSVSGINTLIGNLRTQITVTGDIIDRFINREAHRIQVTESMNNMEFSEAETDPEESLYMEYMQNRDQLDDSLDAIKDIQKQDGIDHTGLKDQLKITFDIYQQIVTQAKSLKIKATKDTVRKTTAIKLKDDEIQFSNSVFEIAQDDCGELRATYARAWWRHKELKYVLQIWTQIRDGLQSASDYLNKRRDALTSAAFASPDPSLTQQELTARASERAAEGRRIARQTPVVSNALNVYSRAVTTMTNERDTAKRALQEAERLLRECEGQEDM